MVRFAVPSVKPLQETFAGVIDVIIAVGSLISTVVLIWQPFASVAVTLISLLSRELSKIPVPNWTP